MPRADGGATVAERWCCGAAAKGGARKTPDAACSSSDRYRAGRGDAIGDAASDCGDAVLE
ncbi:hypothetical protein GCM10022206_83030 [Streptomyces chiangmaiensis]